MGTRFPGFKGEYLWEFDIAARQLSALAEAFPEARYRWRPAETALTGIPGRIENCSDLAAEGGPPSSGSGQNCSFTASWIDRGPPIW